MWPESIIALKVCVSYRSVVIVPAEVLAHPPRTAGPDQQLPMHRGPPYGHISVSVSRWGTGAGRKRAHSGDRIQADVPYAGHGSVVPDEFRLAMNAEAGSHVYHRLKVDGLVRAHGERQ